MEKHCAWCWRTCSDDRADSGDADLDRRRSDGHATGICGVERDGATALNENAFSGQVYIFRGRRGDLIKVLWFDGDGLCLFSKDLSEENFCGRKRRVGRCH